MEYKPSAFEDKWRKYWADQQVYKVENDTSKPKYYVLDMFPYPSGAGLHVGHPLGYIASDIFSRYKRLQGFNVLHPMGYDSFGLPAEQYALETGVHPADSTEKNIATYRNQLDRLGLSFDWSREVRTSDASFYKWTQWIFVKMFHHYYNTELQKARPIDELIAFFEKNGSLEAPAHHSLEKSFSASEWSKFSNAERDSILMNFRIAYRREGTVNWCEALGTVLANDEVVNGVSERGAYPVEMRPMQMWSLRTTAYADRLLKGLETVDFSEAVKAMQRNWIGRSTGARIFLEIESHPLLLEIYTTRPDTIFGVSFMVLAPDHDYVAEITTPAQKAEVELYVKYVKSRSERERQAEVREVTGAFTGAYAVHPVTSQPIPIYISEYVLKGYGTGAIMAVPADDERDQRFAEKFGLPIIQIIDKSKYPGATIEDKVGIMINSRFLDGMEVPDAIEAMCDYLEKNQIGGKKIVFRLRDATFSRQRYWGEPIPAVYLPDGSTQTLSESELPLVLPRTSNFESKMGKGPLQQIEAWWQLPDGSRRETDTMPGFAGSSWYYFRYMDPQNEQAFADPKAIDYWRDVDFYIGGSEHAVGHLLYSRVYHKFLHDLGVAPTEEPYRKLFNQGMIQGIIEKIIFHKPSRSIISADLADRYPEKELSDLLVHVDMVSDYGDFERSHLNKDGIAKYLAWRPEMTDLQFVMSESSPDKLFTRSEIGKMSKSKFNVVNPDEIVDKHGVDCFRLYEMFLGPIEQSKPWNTLGISGTSGFMRRLWTLFYNEKGEWLPNDAPASRDDLRTLHTCIRKVSEDIERFSLNTCVSSFMVCVNDFKKSGCTNQDVLQQLLKLLAPFAPYTTEELWSHFGHKTSIHHATWPQFDAAMLATDSVQYPVCINGKKRGDLELPNGVSQADVEAAALALPAIIKWLEGQTPKKIVLVPGRMVNIVV